MDEMFSYIFGSLKASEIGLRQAREEIGRLQRINRKVIACALLMGVYTLLIEKGFREQNAKIKKIEAELTELRTTNGD